MQIMIFLAILTSASLSERCLSSSLSEQQNQ
ncbi:MAG: hypothetical protein ACI86M_001936, partial [Saprospiraceae bacterium]